MSNLNIHNTSRFLVEHTGFHDLYVIKLKPFIDHRGEFTRMYCNDEFLLLGLKKPVIQINKSRTKKSGTIRGMHFQSGIYAEDKIVNCTAGKVYDVVVDLRPDSVTYLSWFGIELSAENNTALLIPAGFAHGFQTLENNSDIIYFVTTHYNSGSEEGIHPLDPKINIKWPLTCADISEKDFLRPFITI